MRSRIVAAVALSCLWPPAAVAERPRLEPALEASLREARPGAVHVAWVYFSDKGAGPDAPRPELAASAAVSLRAELRRARRGTVSARQAFEDRALEPWYVEQVRLRVLRVRQQLRWFNALSVEATSDQILALAALPFVERLDLVRGFRRGSPEPRREGSAGAAAPADAERPGAPPKKGPKHLQDYGPSYGQVAQIAVPEVHDLGLHGEGVVIAVLDAGFDNLEHEAFRDARILARHDFVNGDGDVANGNDRGEGSHGTATLSTLGGFQPGQIVGPAFGAQFLLAKTEDTESETPVEEDNWAAAAEWAESLGADVISSSLGYLSFDGGRGSYTWADMNGDTAISTRAADLAAERGVVVVASAGNEGLNPSHNTLGAPSDGQEVIAAAAVDADGRRASFSSVGPSADGRIKPDVAAQGQGVYTAGSRSVRAYEESDGTSFSCPLVAGVAALVLQAHPGYTPAQVRSVLRSTASEAASPSHTLGWGIVNALAAIEAPAPAVTSSRVR